MATNRTTGFPPDRPGGAPTFESFAAERYLPFAREHKRSWKTDQRYLKLHVLPYLGGVPLGEITEGTLRGWLSRLEASGLSSSSCCRIFWLVKHMLNCAVRWHILESDETFRHAACVKKAPRRPALLSMEEALKLMRLLDEQPDSPGARAIRLMLLTGARKSEILYARWEDVDLARGVLSTSRTFTGRDRLIPLNREARRFIRSLERKDNCPWLFPSSHGTPISSLHYTWRRLRERLGRPDLRLADLRHSFANFLMNMGIQNPELRCIMGQYMTKTMELVTNKRNSL